MILTRMDRYVAVTVVAGALAGLFVIVCLSFVFEFIDEADNIGQGGYGLPDAMLAVGLSMVQRAYEAFPMATLIGALVSLGALAARSELVVMRAMGLSIGRIARPVVLAGVALAVLAAAIGEWAAPPATRLAQSLQAQGSDGGVATAGGDLWARDGAYMLRIDRVLQPDLLAGVTAYEIEGNQLTRVITAAGGRYVDGAWQLDDAEVTRLGEDRVSVSPMASLELGGELRPRTLEVVVVDASTLAISEILRYIGYLETNSLDSGRYQLALWVKVATPLSTVVMLLLTVPLVFGSQRSAGVGQQIFLGVLIGLAFFLLNRFLGNAGLVYGLPAPVSALAPTVLFGLLAWLALRRTR